MQRFKRLLTMIKMINRGGAPSIYDFCREFERAERTVHEDLRFLREDMFFEIEHDSTRGGYVNRDPKQQLPELDLDEGEFLALMVSSDMLSEYSGTIFEGPIRSALEKISTRLSARSKGNIDDLSEIVKFISNGTARSSKKTFKDLQKAIQDKTPIHLKYFAPSTEETTTRIVDPYRLVQNNGAWYLIAFCRTRNAMRTFALHRIHECIAMPGRFDVDPNFNIDEWMDSAFQIEHGDGEMQYVIHFDSKAAHYVRERDWHSTQKLDEKEDGSCTLSFRATSMDEVKRWVLPYGASAEVLEPEALRNEIASELRNAANRYEAPKVVPFDTTGGTKIAAHDKKPTGPKIATKPSGSGKSRRK